MPKSSKSKSAKRQVKVKDLPKKERKASKDELKKVKGGVDGNDFLMWQKSKVLDPQGRQPQGQNRIAVDPSDPSGNT